FQECPAMSSDYASSFPDYITIRNSILTRNGQQLASIPSADAAEMYHRLCCAYPKFFKMDTLCKWAWLGAETLLRDQSGGYLYDGLDKSSIAVIIATRDGCIEVDHRFQESMRTIPSPALFVYTLPNIMLGEICIRHGFTGEQLCLVQEEFDPESLLFWARDLVTNRGCSHCLFGWADAGNNHEISFFWTDAETLQELTPAQLQFIHNK